MKIVYVAGPFRAPNAWEVERNIRRAEEVAFAVAEAGAMPLCPHTNTRFFDGTITAQFWLDGTMELLRRCDAVVMVPDWEKSSGARGEKAEAERLGIPVFTDIEQLSKWLRAAELLSGCERNELRDHTFGDAELSWVLNGEIVATGYRGESVPSVGSEMGAEEFEFEGPFAAPLLRLGKLGRVERNDSGRDDHDDGDIRW